MWVVFFWVFKEKFFFEFKVGLLFLIMIGDCGRDGFGEGGIVLDFGSWGWNLVRVFLLVLG